jgi:PBP1b-binding outer membrane lipoprotein LpoB
MFCVVILALILTACAEQPSNDANTKTNAGVETTQANKPSKFKVAAINKIIMANAGMSYQQATCVVDQMTVDDKYGIGEINQMKLTADTLDENASGILKTYKDALNHCK